MANNACSRNHVYKYSHTGNLLCWLCNKDEDCVYLSVFVEIVIVILCSNVEYVHSVFFASLYMQCLYLVYSTISNTLSLFTDQDCQFSTCYPLEIVVNFKRPLFLPAEAEVHYYVTEEKGSKVIRLKVTTQKKESLNLEASVVCNASDVSH